MKQKIKSIQLSQAIFDGHTLYDEGGEVVGLGGVTHITSDFPSNAHCEYVYVWKGDRIEDLCESAQDAVREVIRVAREHGRCRRVFGDLNIEIYAHPHPAGGISWGVDSLITHMNTKRGIVG